MASWTEGKEIRDDLGNMYFKVTVSLHLSNNRCEAWSIAPTFYFLCEETVT